MSLLCSICNIYKNVKLINNLSIKYLSNYVICNSCSSKYSLYLISIKYIQPYSNLNFKPYNMSLRYEKWKKIQSLYLPENKIYFLSNYGRIYVSNDDKILDKDIIDKTNKSSIYKFSIKGNIIRTFTKYNHSTKVIEIIDNLHISDNYIIIDKYNCNDFHAIFINNLDNICGIFRWCLSLEKNINIMRGEIPEIKTIFNKIINKCYQKVRVTRDKINTYTLEKIKQLGIIIFNIIIKLVNREKRNIINPLLSLQLLLNTKGVFLPYEIIEIIMNKM